MRIPRGAVLGAASLVLTGEAAFRVLGDRLPRRSPWHDRVAELKVEQMRRLHRRSPRTDVVFAGSSQMLLAVDPVLAGGELAYNAALHRGVPTVMERWLPEVVVPLLHPGIVVLGVSSLDFNDAGSFHLDVTRRFNETPAMRRGLRARTLRALERRSALVRHREAIANPTALARAAGRVLAARDDAAQGDRAEARALESIGAAGESHEFDGMHYLMTPKKTRFIREEVGVGYRLGPLQTGALERLGHRLRTTRIGMVLALVPVTPDFLALLDGGEATHRASIDAARDVAERVGARFVDVTEAMKDSAYFADCIHLNDRGRVVFSRLLRAGMA